MEKVTYEEFKKMDIRVGRVVAVEAIEGADKLLKLHRSRREAVALYRKSRASHDQRDREPGDASCC